MRHELLTQCAHFVLESMQKRAPFCDTCRTSSRLNQIFMGYIYNPSSHIWLLGFGLAKLDPTQIWVSLIFFQAAAIKQSGICISSVYDMYNQASLLSRCINLV